MPHVSEGDLHAYLDGGLGAADPAVADRVAAHLASCADCRSRLEAERAVRDRSAALLEVALGEPVDAPPFEEIRRAAADRRGGAEPSTGRAGGSELLRRFAWAASIVVALGAGWMAHAVTRGGAGVPARSPEASGAIAEVVTEPRAGREQEEAAGERLRLDDAVRADAERPDPPAPPSTLEAESNRASALDESRQDAREREADAPAERQASALGQGRAPAPEIASAQTEPAPEDAPQLRREAAVVETAKSALGDVAASTRGIDALSASDWRPVAPDAGAAWVGAALRRVPELQVLDAAVAEVDGRRYVRMRQRLPGGETLVLYQAAAPAPEGRASVDRDLVTSDSGWVTTGGVRVRLVAPVAPDSLAVLLSRVR